MWNSMIAFALRVLLYASNIFLIVSFVLFCTNYFQVNTLDYYQTTRTYRIIFLVYLIVLILLGAVCCRKAKLPLAIYKLYLTILTIAVVFCAIFLVFDLDKTETVTQQLRDDVEYFNKHNESTAALDQLQSHDKCCGVKDLNDYTLDIPASCIKSNKTDDSKGKNGIFKERQLLIEDHQEDADDSAINLSNSDWKNRVFRTSVFVPYLGRINTDKAGEDAPSSPPPEDAPSSPPPEGGSDEEPGPKEYYPLGCLAKLEQTHMSQKSITVKLLITVSSSSFAAILIIFLLIFIKKD